MAASIRRTTSAGTRLELWSHFHTAGWDTPQIAASADWLPAASTAAWSASNGEGGMLIARVIRMPICLSSGTPTYTAITMAIRVIP